jgi:hypothetical protein
LEETIRCTETKNINICILGKDKAMSTAKSKKISGFVFLQIYTKYVSITQKRKAFMKKVHTSLLRTDPNIDSNLEFTPPSESSESADV